MKKTISMVIIFMLIFTLVPAGLATKAEAATKENWTVDNFVFDLYRADLYLDSESGNACNKSISMLKEFELPSDDIARQLNDDGDFQKLVTAWKGTHMAVNPSEITEGYLDLKGYYETIIFSVFLAEQEDEQYLFEIAEGITADSMNLLSNVHDVIEASEKINMEDGMFSKSWMSLSIEEQNVLSDEFAKAFKLKYPEFAFTSDVNGYLDEFLSAGSSIEDGVLNMISYMNLVNISENMKATMKYMYETCPDGAMREALEDASTAMNSTALAFSVGAFNAAEKGAATVVGEGIEKFIDAAVNLCPITRAMKDGADIGTYIGTNVSNSLFSTDKTVESYIRMCCLNEFTSLLKQTIYAFEDSYLVNRSVENANNYFAALDAYYQTLNISCDFAKTYGSAIYNDAIVGRAIKKVQTIICGNSSYDEYVTALDYIKESYQSEHEVLLELVYNYLEAEYLDIYKVICAIRIGSCGDNTFYYVIPYRFDVNLKGYYKLFIDGTGTIDEMPWESTYGQKIREVCIEDGVTHIRENAFEQYENLENVHIADSVKTIGKHAFYLCESLKIVSGCEGLEVIEPWAFASCYNLESIVIPESVSNELDHVFFGCSSLKTAGPIGGNYNLQFGWRKRIPDYAFKNSYIVSVVLPETISEIGKEAFFDCDYLEEINIPYNVTEIGQSLFRSCDRLKSIHIPVNIRKIGKHAFYLCESLKIVSGCEGLEVIEPWAFASCHELESIVIPDSIENELDHVFFGCSSLVTAGAIGGNYNLQFAWTEKIPYGAFANSSIRNVTIPDTVTEIDDRAFKDCSRLQTVDFSSSVITIGNNCFDNCDSIETIYIPNNVQSIGDYAFYGCEKLKEVSGCEGLNTIGYCGFGYCWDLEKITLKRNVKYIGDAAFETCSLLSIYGEIPSDSYYYAMDNNINFVEINENEFVEHRHTWATDYTIDKAPTCTEKGFKSIHCLTCDERTDIEEMAEISHRNKEKILSVDSTCTSTGLSEGERCADCGIVLKEQLIISKKGHTYGNWTIDKAAGCETAGSKYRTCKCGAKETAAIYATGHISRETIPAIAATCTETGLTAGEKCRDCGVILIEQQITNALGHASVVDKAVAATRKSTGKSEGSHCSRCNNVLTEQYKVPKISTVKFGKLKLMYTGKIIKPTVTIKNADGKNLKSGVDYKLSYKNGAGKKIVTPKNVGKYTMIVTFQGKYSGSTSVKYTVIPKTTGITKLTTPAQNQIKANWTKCTAQVDGYEVWFSTNKNFTKSTTKKFTVAKAKTNFKLVKNLKSKKTYHVKVRTYKKANGVKYYSNWSAVKKIKSK